jgi:hypothetical protein
MHAEYQRENFLESCNLESRKTIINKPDIKRVVYNFNLIKEMRCLGCVTRRASYLICDVESLQVFFHTF